METKKEIKNTEVAPVKKERPLRVAEDTVEEDAMRSLSAKADGQTAMMEAIKARIERVRASA